MTDTTYDTAAPQAVSDLSGTYTVDASHSRLGFTARHAMVTNVKGSFGSFVTFLGYALQARFPGGDNGNFRH